MDKLETFLVAAPVILFSMVAHEYAHGYAALKNGDPTARDLGRLSWNPLKHIDPFRTILLPLITFFGSSGRFIFGGAKPVPVDPRNYRHYRRGDIIVSLAGVATNAVLVVVCGTLVAALGVLGRSAPSLTSPLAILQVMLSWGMLFNAVLAIFNLLPIPPLDGSHVVKHLLPPRLAVAYQRVGAYGLLIVMLLLSVGQPVMNAWMRPVFVILGAAIEMLFPYFLPSPVPYPWSR